MNFNKIDITAFDLDGTLLNDKKIVSNRDYDTLQNLGKENILRVACTGRNLYSLNRVLPPNFPMDYAVFSSGAGIFDWKAKKILKCWFIKKTDIQLVISKIKPYKLNFTIHLPIPNNHHILLYDKQMESEDLKNYTSFYKEFVTKVNFERLPEKATQLIVLLNSHSHLFNSFSHELTDLKTILTTSPVDNNSMWMEVFNKNVSKANGLSWLIAHLNIIKPSIFAIGNDYNDLDLLKLSHFSFVVNNAPDSLKQEFKTTKSNNENALTESLKQIIKYKT